MVRGGGWNKLVIMPIIIIIIIIIIFFPTFVFTRVKKNNNCFCSSACPWPFNRGTRSPSKTLYPPNESPLQPLTFFFNIYAHRLKNNNNINGSSSVTDRQCRCCWQLSVLCMNWVNHWSVRAGADRHYADSTSSPAELLVSSDRRSADASTDCTWTRDTTPHTPISVRPHTWLELLTSYTPVAVCGVTLCYL